MKIRRRTPALSGAGAYPSILTSNAHEVARPILRAMSSMKRSRRRSDGNWWDDGVVEHASIEMIMDNMGVARLHAVDQASELG